MEQLTLEIESLYEIYKNVVIRHETVKKEAQNIWCSYINHFGKLLEKRLELNIEYVKLRKLITYCQMAKNKGEKYNLNDIEKIVEEEIEDFYEELTYISNIRKFSTIMSKEDSLLLKRIYKKIAMLIHPDINPDIYKHEEIVELWMRAKDAYKISNLDELITVWDVIQIKIKELGLLQNCQIDNIEQKISDTRNKIEKVISTKPYVYKDLLNDEEAISDKEHELNEEIANYEEHVKLLKLKLEEYKEQKKWINL